MKKKLKVRGLSLALLVSFVLVSQNAFAIPTPDIIVNVFSSVAHVVVIAGAYLAALFFSTRQQIALLIERYRTGCLVGLLLVAATSTIAFIFTYTKYQEQKYQRLATNLDRTYKQAGIFWQDPELKALELPDQIKHPKGIEGKDLAQMLQKKEKVLFYDVREVEEYVMGGIQGTARVSYPEMKLNPAKFLKGHEGEKVYLLCANGNRSSELVNEFELLGYENIYFVIGGFEKWRKELPYEYGPYGKLLQRDVEPFPNKNALLDTPDVVRLFQKGDVVFVDNRYPHEFELTRLPSAYNFPVRKLNAAEMEEYINGIPKDKKLIGVCYDRRSCFWDQILGARLSKRGYAWLGRYTVPFEFNTAWLDAKASDAPPGFQVRFLPARGFSKLLAQPFLKFLEMLESVSKNWGVAILLLTFFIRLLMFPLTYKADRLQLRLKELKPALDGIKKETRDYRERNRRILDVYARENVQPLLTLLVAVVQVVVFFWIYRVLASSTNMLQGSPFLWVSNLASRDPFFILPVLVGLGVFLIPWCQGSSPFEGKNKFVYPIIAIVFVLLTYKVQAALSLYIAVSLILISLQQRFVSRPLYARHLRTRTA